MASTFAKPHAAPLYAQLFYSSAAGFAGASLYLLTNRSQHPSVEAGKGRQDSLHEVGPYPHLEVLLHLGWKRSRILEAACLGLAPLP